MIKKTKRRAAFYLLGASFLWGSSFIGSKICLNAGMFTFETVFYRSFLGIIIMYLCFAKKLQHISPQTWQAGLALGIVTAFSYSCEMTGIARTTTAKASLLVSTNIIIVPFLCALFYRQKVSGKSLFAALLALLGVVMLNLTKNITLEMHSGEVYLLVAAVCYASSSLIGGKWAAKYSTLQVTFIQLTVVTLVMAVMMAQQGRCGVYEEKALAACLYLTLGPTVLCFFVKNYALCYLSPLECTLILATQSIFCVLLSKIIFQEVITLRLFFGMLLILSGILLEQLGDKVVLKLNIE